LKTAFSVGYIFDKFVPTPEGVAMDQIDYLWQAAYMAAVYETDDSLMEGRILEARSAIEERLLSPIEGEEYRAIQYAEKALNVLRAERVHKTHLSAANPSRPSMPVDSSPQALE
jgi:hypothetical protein